MNFRKIFGVVATVMLAGSSAFAATSGTQYIPGDVIVKYKDGALRPRTLMNNLYDTMGVQNVRRFGGMMKGFERLRFGSDVKVHDVISELSKNPLIEYAEPNYVFSIQPTRFAAVSFSQADEGGIPCLPGVDIPNCDPNAKWPCLIPGIPFPPGCVDGGGGGGGQPPSPTPVPNPPGKPLPPVADAPADVIPPVADPDLAKIWGIAKIGAPEAWKTTRGDKKMVVAVIDTGVDYNHEDLSYNIWRNPNPTKGDLVGYDFVSDTGMPFDDNMHGTHCSGTIGAVGGNGKAISGVNQYVSIMALKFLSAQGQGSLEQGLLAIDYAIEHGAKVLSNSWGGQAEAGEIKSLREAIERARAKDVLFIAAAGNDGVDNDTSAKKSYPAALDNDNLISVAASDENDGKAFFSNYGVKTTLLAAPGTNIYSTVPGNSYRKADGTSMAAPHVAGAAALVWSKNPSMTYKEVKDILAKSVDILPAFQGKTITGGRLNVAKALAMVKAKK